MTDLFIDGSAGTTGLRIAKRLQGRNDIHVIILPEEQRKDPAARTEALRSAEIAILCLPDAASEEAAALAPAATALIDTSTAHRTTEGWAYGLPELPGNRARIAASARIANPGCHASGFIALTAPLVREGLIAADTALSCFSVTGYSGGGKKMIADYEAERTDASLNAPRQYALGQQHKHLREMTAVSGLSLPPVFCPIVADFYAGMAVTVPLHARDLRGTRRDVEDLYRACYHSRILHYEETAPGAMLCANALSGRDDMIVSVTGNDDRLLLTAVYDNLGKGASGAAIQNLNILLGAPEETGLVL